ncbi:MAG: hypothetical protein JNK27_01480 [Chitinophagaceae bacterium]|nr:hypothetical protein [Chitinophagaceae bacterium]
MLTDQELLKVFAWLPYRENWPIDRNQKEDNIENYYGSLIKCLTQSKIFDTYFSEDGGLGNYLEFICYPFGQHAYDGNAILVCISLCSPIAAYGQTTLHKTNNSIGWSFISPETIGSIGDPRLKSIEKEIIKTIEDNNLKLIDKVFAARQLPSEVIERLKNENHNAGTQYLHGLFQKTD